MAAGAYAELIAGDCLARPAMDNFPSVTNIFQPFRQITAYMAFGTYSGNVRSTSNCGCGRKQAIDGSYQSSFYGTTDLPPFMLTSGSYSRGELYGRKPLNNITTTDPVLLKHRSTGEPVYFKTAEFQPWRKRSKMNLIAGNTGYDDFASGPPLQYGLLTMPLRRRLKGTTGLHNRNYQGRMTFDFTNASVPINGQTDWLGNLHPANHFWTNEDVPEPFKSVSHFEDCGASPKAPDSLYQYTVPFCGNMPAYNAAGIKVGEYTGYTAQFYFALGFVHFADAKNWVTNTSNGSVSQKPAFLPDDYRSPLDPQTGKRLSKIRHVEQLITLDIHIFMVGDNAQLGSPKLVQTRYWWYNDPYTTPWINQPYMCGFTTSGVYPSWNFPVQYEILGTNNAPTTPEVITLGFDPLSVWVTA